MIIAIVQFPIDPPLPREEAEAVFRTNAQLYQGRDDLKRKFYIRSPDGRTVGGIYVWRAQADADAFYTAEWRALVTKKYGVAPSVTFFECPYAIDNEAQQPG